MLALQRGDARVERLGGGNVAAQLLLLGGQRRGQRRGLAKRRKNMISQPRRRQANHGALQRRGRGLAALAAPRRLQVRLQNLHALHELRGKPKQR